MKDFEKAHLQCADDIRSSEAGYFPMFIDLRKKKIVVVGAGAVARRRIRTLLPFGADILVVAPVGEEEAERMIREEMSYIRDETEESRLMRDKTVETRLKREFQPEWLKVLCKPYEPSVCEGAFMVLAATDDRELNARICREAKAAGALVNNASDRSQCDFYFPAVIRQGADVIGINTGGEDHRRTKALRQRIETFLNK